MFAVTVRGDIESVLDLRAVLGLPVGEERERMILLACGGSIRSGVLIDTVEDVADVPRSAILSTPTTLGGDVRDYVAGQLVFGGRNVVLLDLGRIFARAAMV